jgi:rSAM/selenodomain-associated transferase 2
MALRSVSVVIPALNEALALPETVSRARANTEAVEIIVVDGGSRDGTLDMAKSLGCVALTSKPGRGSQMRQGAAVAKGDVVMLLHADTWLPPHAARAALDCLSKPGVAGGGFWKQFRNAPLLMRGSRARCAARLWLNQRIAGDQGMFVARETLEKVGGVPDLPLMEEFELCARLRRVGKLSLADAVVLTSARRFRERGVIRTYLRMWRVMTHYWLGASPAELQKLYEKR